MKTKLFLIGALIFGLSLTQSPAQFGPSGGGAGNLGVRGMPKFDGTFAKIFGDNSAFSADLEIQTEGGKGEAAKMPGKIVFLDGKTRFEIEMAAAAGGKLPPESAAQMKAMGMDRLVIINRPDKKLTFMVYPGLEAFAEMENKDAEDPKAAEQFKTETTELGKETLDGHACVKNKVIITDDKGTKHESTSWNATDLKKFPLKIVTTERGTEVTMVFKNVKLAKPDGALFDPPKQYKKYNNFMEMMQQEMMQRMGAGAGGFQPPPRGK